MAGRRPGGRFACGGVVAAAQSGTITPMDIHASPRPRHDAACAVSGHLDTRTAGMEVAEQLDASIGAACDLAIVFASFHHCAALPEAVETIRETIHPRALLAVTAESVLGGEEELEGVAGLTALAMHLPGVTLSPWVSTPENPIGTLERFGNRRVRKANEQARALGVVEGMEVTEAFALIA